ncbi:putative GATA transcription factor 9 [Hibiscus syriacus]|uniref:GATA transcription factor 9 n=1 Tax=Hibiscus syriacus TaxID=106335 RepID=A0A6A2XQF9_HIBSY|nr:protein NONRESPONDING TO OXYLIPINS 2, mitochondrial-like isoform X2 [Hibiscus syriacus]KAE8677828.1 putative GATA transcription factor 9 [Hibiscus syriacus]
MASRLRSVSKPAFSILKSTIHKSTLKPSAASPHFHVCPSYPTFPRPVSQLGSLQSLLPLHSAVSSARLTSCLGTDSMCSRSLSQGVDTNKGTT